MFNVVNTSNGLRRDIRAVAFDYSANGKYFKYVEVDGGAHYVFGRSSYCAAGGSTHDVDIATEYLKFMAASVSGSNL